MCACRQCPALAQRTSSATRVQASCLTRGVSSTESQLCCHRTTATCNCIPVQLPRVCAQWQQRRAVQQHTAPCQDAPHVGMFQRARQSIRQIRFAQSVTGQARTASRKLPHSTRRPAAARRATTAHSRFAVGRPSAGELRCLVHRAAVASFKSMLSSTCWPNLCKARAVSVVSRERYTCGHPLHAACASQLAKECKQLFKLCHPLIAEHETQCATNGGCKHCSLRAALHA